MKGFWRKGRPSSSSPRRITSSPVYPDMNRIGTAPRPAAVIRSANSRPPITGITTSVNLPITATPAIEAAGMFPAAAPTTGTLFVKAPFEMQIFEGETLLGLTGSRLELAPGPHSLEIVSETLSFRSPTTVEIVAGKNTRVPVVLPKGTANLNATPWAEVWVDGEKVGETPLGNLALTIGPHEIVFKHPELGEQAHAAIVTAAAPLRLSVNLTKPQ